MKRIFVWSIATFFLTAVAAGIVFQKYVQAEEEMHSYPSVVPFGVGAGRVGFFDRTTGKLYIYNENLDNCVFIGQMAQLGQPFKKEKSDTNVETIRYDRFNKDLLKYKPPTQ